MNGQTSDAAPPQAVSTNKETAGPSANEPRVTRPHYEDDEEEEGMVKVEEEGQIQDESPANMRLHPPASYHRAGNSPEHDRERSRYYGTSPDPSSSHVAARSAHSQTPEASHGPSTYMHSANSRDPAWNEAYPARSSFSVPPPRVEGPRRSYGSVSSASSSRTPDVYRSAGRDREREWDIAREREQEWALERERDPYRYREMESRREWERDHRERSMMHHDTADYPPIHSAHSPYGPNYGYAFDGHEYGRASSPSIQGRDRSRDFDRERERGWDRDRANDRTDPRSRSQSAAWGMRSWGKPSEKPTDAGWDSRQRRTVTGGARSVSPKLATSSKNTFAPTSQNGSAEHPPISGSLSDRGEARSRESSPRSTRSAGHWQAPSHLGAEHREASPRDSPRPSFSTPTEPNPAALPQPRDAQEFSGPKEKSLLERMTDPTPSTEPVNDSEHSGNAEQTEEKADQPVSLADPLVSQSDADKTTAPEDVPALEAPKSTSPDPEAQPATQDVQEPVLEQEPPSITQSEEQLGASTAEDAVVAPATAEPPEKVSEIVASPPRPSQLEDEPEAPKPAKAEEVAVSENGPAAQGDLQEMEIDKAEIAPASQATAPISAPVTTQENVPLQSQSDDQDSKDVVTKAVAEQAQAEPNEEQPLEPMQHSVEQQPLEQAVRQAVEEQPLEQAVRQAVEEQSDALAAAPVSSVSLPAVSSALEAADVSTIARYARAEEAQRQHLDSQQVTVHEPASVALISDNEVTAPVETAATQSEDVPRAQIEPDESIDSKQALLSSLEPAVEPASSGLPEADVSLADPGASQPVLKLPTASTADSEALTVKLEPSSADVSMAEVSAELGADSIDMAIDEEETAQSETVAEPTVLPSKQEISPQALPGGPSANESVPVDENPADEPVSLDGPPTVNDSVPVATESDVSEQIREVMLPRLGAEAPEDAKEETARMQELEIIPSREPRLLDIAAIDGIDKDIEPPMLTPKTQEQVDMVARAGILRALAHYRPSETTCFNIIHENQKLSQSTTMDLLHAKVHGVPLSVSEDKPLWIDEDDADVARSKAYIFDQMMDRQKRMNKKVESLKSRYRTINAEWKLHCARLDRIAERREQQQRRPTMTTPAGTPAGAAGDEPSNGGSGILGAALLTGRANRRNTQTGFAGFGDAVRSEAEFLEILASLENADMQDPSVRAARTTATAPDMQLDAYHNRPLEETYDDINGFVADPLAFYLDKFDPDVWTDDEKAIFARRYALWPKQFGKIAQALPHKTPSQCVRYYYLNKKATGNDFKALAAARNRERKRKARGKPKKAKGSALMADLKSAKGEELEEDDGGVGSPGEMADGAAGRGDTSGTVTPRRGGPARSRMPTAQSDSSSTVADEFGNTPHGKKRSAAPDGADSPSVEGKSSEKRRSTPKTKRAKTSDSTKLGDKFKKARTAAKQEALPNEPMRDAVVAQQLELPATEAGVIDRKESGVEDSDLAAAEALGALANMFGGGAAPKLAEAAADTSFERPDGNVVDGESQKPGKKRKSKGAIPGQEEMEPGSKGGRSKQPTSSYWSVAERSEFLRALALHGKHWEVVSSTLSQKSAAQARNYFARNGSEPDFMDAAALADKNHGLTLAEREAAATLFVRQRSAANAAQGNTPTSQPPMPPAGTGTEPLGAQDAPRTTYLPPPPALSSSAAAEPVDLKRREESREPVTVRRGLQINSLLNSADDNAETRASRRLSDEEWHQRSRSEAAHEAYEVREGSLPVGAYSRRALAVEPETRPSTAGDADILRPSSAEDRPIHGSAGEQRTRMYEPFGVHRQAPTYTAMAPPHYPSDRYSASQPPSRYSLPPPSAPSLSRSMTPHHLTSEGSESTSRPEYGRYSAAPPDYRGHKEHESQSLPPLHSSESRHAPGYEKHSPTNSSFPSSLHASYGRYSSPAGSVGSLYSSASRRSIGGPGGSLGPSTSERSTSEHRWQRPSASPGPQGSVGSSSGYGSTGGAYSTGNTYRSTGHAYSSNYPSQNLPRPSLPSVSSSGRSLPPLLGTFPGSGPRPLGSSRPRPSDDSQKWPYSQHENDHQQ